MPTPEPKRFRWHGLDRQGRPQDGSVTAIDLARARAQLRQQGWRISYLAPDGARGAHGADGSDDAVDTHLPPVTVAATPARRAWRAAIPQKQLVLFTRQLATMLQAGLPLLQSLDIAIAGAAGTPLAALLHTVRRDVAQGDSLHAALARHPRHFDELCCQLVHAAEQAGLLDTMFDRIATYGEKSLALRGRIRAALAYPCAVLLVALVITVVIMLWVVPSFERMFHDFGAELPLATQVVVTASRRLAQHGHWLLLALGLSALALRWTWRRSARWRAWWQGCSLRLPLFGRLLQQAAIARWSRTFATLLGAGIALPEALDSAGGASGNSRFARASQVVREAVRNGVALHAAMRGSGVFGALAVQMAAVGEQAGALDAMLARLAAIHEREVDDGVAALTSLMEPIIMAVLGVLIGGLVVVMYLPVFSMGSVV